ncbi:putative cytochrome p450 [Rosellinia necatrix]|uniref:Putative cytochrome p450 n=1 Tax=Rosellinia necatrix TaxID=77044 RepID=A0A1W2TIV0_ROSNE|nr:putative cytochrome p450 [Rosellinia necatrix]
MGVLDEFTAALPALTPMLLFLNVIGLSLFGFIAYSFWSWRRLRHIPGPFLGSVSSFWMVKISLTGAFHQHLRHVSELYGPLVRIGPNELLSTDPEILRMMSAVRSPYTKGVFYETGRITPEEDTVVSLRDEKKHRTLRAKMGLAFGGKENEGFGFGAGIDRQILSLVNLIDNRYLSTSTEYRPVQFFQKISFFALDVIGDISFGGAFGYLDQDTDLYRYNQINDESIPLMSIASTIPWLANIIYKWPFSRLLPREGDRVGFGRLMGLVKSVIDARLAPNAKPQKDMMQAFINSGMSRAELTQQVFVQIIAGSVSTTTAICMTLLCLLTNPAAYSTLQREIDDAVAAGRVSDPIGDAESRGMPYLQAVIREGLRFYPPVMGLGSKQVPAGGDVINGFFVPGGTQVGMNFFGLMRSRAIWGRDADAFRPERWLEADADRARRMNAVVDLDFGFGKYQCLGKPIASMELNKIFVELLRRYDFTIVNPQEPIKAWTAIFWVANDFWLRITKRDPVHKA